MNAIEVKDVVLDAGPSNRHTLSFTVERGTVCGLVGKNGAGKTLLLQALVKQHKLNKGDILLLGQSVTTQFEEVKPDIGVVWAMHYGPLHFTANMYRDFYKPLYKSWDDDYFYRLLEQFKIYRNEKLKTYSAGMLMKLQLALALAHHPKLLILDEPTAHLDPFARDELMELLAAYMESGDNTMIISSHILSDLEKIADTILYMEAGDILYHENKDAMTSEYVIWRGELSSIVPQSAIIASKRTELSREYLLAKKLLPDMFFEKYGQHVQAPTIEEYLLYTEYATGEGKS